MAISGQCGVNNYVAPKPYTNSNYGNVTYSQSIQYSQGPQAVSVTQTQQYANSPWGGADQGIASGGCMPQAQPKRKGWFAKLLGGIGGFLMGGPIGAFIGSKVGGFFARLFGRNHQAQQQQAWQQQQYAQQQALAQQYAYLPNSSWTYSQSISTSVNRY